MRKFVYIGVFGAAGAVLRYLIKGLSSDPLGILSYTLIINVTGCFALAFVYMTTLEFLEVNSSLRLGVATGLIGSFTTFASFCRETCGYLFDRAYGTALLYYIVMALLGFTATFLGIIAARRVEIRRLKRLEE